MVMMMIWWLGVVLGVGLAFDAGDLLYFVHPLKLDLR
jgi:hypothetical protein